MLQVSIGQVKRDISELVNRVAFRGERIVLTSRGNPKAAIVSIEDYLRLQQLDQSHTGGWDQPAGPELPTGLIQVPQEHYLEPLDLKNQSNLREQDEHQATLSPKFQVVIPLAIRKQLEMKPGQKMRVIAYDDKVILIPVRPIQTARGSLKGIDTTIERDELDRV